MSEPVIALPQRKWLDLSMAQQAVWLDAKLSGTSDYQLGGWARIAGPLDASAVRRSVRLVMARHDAMRLRVDSELPRQWLDDSAEPPLSILDLPDGLDPDIAFGQHVEKLFASAMQLGDRPLFQIELVRAGSDLNYLLWRFHHLVADSASVLITLNHWLNAYEALTSPSPEELKPPSSYLKTINADAKYLESAAHHQDLAYWSSRFDPLPPPLIADMEVRPREHQKVPSAELVLSGDRFIQFQKSAVAAGATANRALFSLFALTLGKRFGQSDIVTGVALHRRDITNLHTIGMMAGVVAVRCAFDPSASIEECTRAFSKQLDADLRHQRLPVDILSRALGFSGTGRAGLFEAAMSYIPADRGETASALEGLPVTTGIVETKEASPISLHVTDLPSGGGMSVKVAVNTAFLEASEAQTLSIQLQSTVDRFLSAPETKFEELDTVSAAERQLVIADWNQTASTFEVGTLDGLFAAQSKQTPDAVAVVGVDGVALSYAQLDQRSTQLAGQLVAAGVRPDQVVGVRMVRSTETIIALLSILKAGGVYLPLDPAYPSDRLDFIAKDAGAVRVLESLDGLAGEGELPTLSDPARLAYVIYTSGTTGVPKGVAVPHSAGVNLAFARRACHDPIGVGDRILAAISVGFDVSIGQLLLPLLSGATVVVAGDVKTMGGREFWSLLAERGVTHINSVPSFLDSILESAPAAGTLALKRLMLGGEALSGSLVRRIQKSLPGVAVVNMYGPTEACIDATYRIATADDLDLAVLPIGRPLSNYTAYVLDAHYRPVGVGVSGELYLGGAGLARGYVNAPDLTAQRFVADPFNAGAKLYKTGDRARFRVDGAIEFLGRVDEQVKIRGFRVEPGEIENVLLRHPEVAQAVVVPRATKPGAALQLVAYIVPHTGQSVPETADIRTYLAAQLPDYMVPSAFVAIEEIPLTHNGKLDLKALPSPDLTDGEYVAPRNAAEEAVAALFAEVLGLDRCGANDHFFELGGHSLLAVTLIERMRQQGLPGEVRALFLTPTVAGFAATLAGGTVADAVPENRIVAGSDHITPDMLPLIQLNQSQIEGIVASVPGGASNVQDIYPLAPLQEGIFFQHLIAAEGDPYLTPFLLGFGQRSDLDAFVNALKQVVQRHDVLRTAMTWKNLDKPVQVVWRHVEVVVQQVELDQAALMSRFSPQTHRLDLAKAPLLDAVISKDGDRWLLLLLTHHLVLDHTSLEILMHELRMLMADPAAVLPPSPPYRNFIAQSITGQNRQEQISFFTKMLGDLDEPTTPFGLLEIQGNASRIVEDRLTINPELSSRIRLRSRAMGVTPASLFHLAWAVVLGHVAGKSDVVFGTVLFGRMQSGTDADRVVGMFINTLPIRVKLDETSAAEGVKQIHQLLAELSAHEHAPLVIAQECSALPSSVPLFSSLFNYRHSAGQADAAGDAGGMQIVEVIERTNYPLAMAVDDLGTGFLLDAQGLPEAEPARVCQYLQQALKELLDLLDWAPGKAINTLQVLPIVERQLVVSDWNQTASSFAVGTLDGLFTAQSKKTPDTVAVVGVDGKTLSYAELDERSTQLARQLVANGVLPDQVVGVRMVRSTETIIALLGILKAGGVYLPLDPAYPSDRLDFIAKDAGAVRVLESLDGLAGEGELPTLSDPARLAYVIYTSGTTGVPKGVAVPHSAGVNLAFARRACHDPIGVGDRILAAISVGFDVSIGQLLLPLLSGATVVVAGDVKTMGGREFWSLLAERGVTHINSVPSFLDSILESAPAAGTLALKRLMLGGEALSGSLVRRIQKSLPGVAVVNMYGPTEACIDATYHIATADDLDLAVLPIGRPLSNYTAYVLDAHYRPVGVGVSGELYLGGAGLARGYVNAPDLTAQRFVADPFNAGAKLYKTGDRARFRVDGAIEFLGRVDEQVKIRGFRVEPGEIEAQLRRQPGVREAAVIAVGNNGTTRLIAYCTGEATAESLRAGLATSLPDYMVPAAFVKLDALPLTANGKLDRRALPALDQDAFAGRTFEAPIGETEEKMAALWAQMLKLERVGRNDNFFELGGHSLLAVTLVERMRQENLPGDVRALFATPTIAGLAAASTNPPAQVAVPENQIPAHADRITPDMLPLVELKQPQIDSIVESVPGGVENLQDIYPLAPLQEGILFQHFISAEGDPYLNPVLLGFDNHEKLDAFINALKKVIERHDVLRTAMAWKNLDQPLQIVWRYADLAVEELALDRADLLSRFDPKIYRLDLSKAPLLRAVVSHDVSHGDDRWMLLLLMHHLILDQVSVQIVIHELHTLMHDSAAVLPVPQPYRNFVAETQGGLTRQEHEAFFRGLLGDVTEPTAPFGVVDVQASAPETTEFRTTVEPELSRRIREGARAAAVAPASLFHLAWAVVLAHICGKDDVVFGTLLLGRMGAAADRAVGMFINTLPIRIQLNQTSVADSAKQCHQLLSTLMMHEHAPLALAQRCSGVPAPTPLFSSLFNYRFSPAGLSSEKLDGVEVLSSSGATNYPLAMAVDDLGETFSLEASARTGIDPGQVCGYLRQAVESLVERLAHEPGASVQTLQVLPIAERQLVIADWNQTASTFEVGTLDGLFTTQSKKTPDAVAVVGVDGKALSYAELDQRSTQLARQLVSAGVYPDQVVGVRMVRSTETIIALLGILKAGGVYLPLDPAYPSDRLDFIAKDAGAVRVLESLDGLAGEGELPTLSDPARLAYVIYTSGTTGVPKGVAVPHSAGVNLAFARRACHDRIGVGDRILAAISVGFDVSIGQLLLPLLSGATVVVAGDVKTMGGREFWSLLAERGVTHINSVPSFLDSILESAPAAGTLALKRLMLGGEALSGSLVRRIQKSLPGVAVVNMYGPTEACIDATYHIATADDLDLAVLPIGRPLSNYTAYVLDAHRRPVGVGVSGELYLGGAGLARGYVNAPDLTAQRFVADPFTPGAKLYKTGDRARFRVDGAIEFLGRVDEQVKIRGFRVEPGEIEAQLRLQPGVREAAVIAVGNNGTTRLIAYCTGEATAESLRAGLATSLPDYMVPAAFVKLDALPLTANGKLDRRALPALDQDVFAGRAYEAPIGETEEKMAALWAQLLKLERVGRNDNFFEVGGDSLVAMRLVNIIGSQFNVPVPVRAMFQNPTVASLTQELFSTSKVKRSRNLVPLQATGSRPNLYLMHASSGHVFGYLPLVRALGPDQPVYGLQASGLEEGEKLATSIDQAALEYVDAIQVIQPHGPYHMLGFSSGGLLAFEMARQFKARGEETALLVILDTTLPDPTANREVTQDEVVLDTAATIGIADLIGKKRPLPRLDQLVEIGRQAGRLPDDLQSKYVEGMGDCFRNTCRIVPDYRPGTYDGPTLLVRATQRPGPPVDWSPYVAASALEIEKLKCNHPQLISPKISPLIAAMVTKRITRLLDSANKPSEPAGDLVGAAVGDGEPAPASSDNATGFAGRIRSLLKKAGR